MIYVSALFTYWLIWWQFMQSCFQITCWALRDKSLISTVQLNEIFEISSLDMLLVVAINTICIYLFPTCDICSNLSKKRGKKQETLHRMSYIVPWPREVEGFDIFLSLFHMTGVYWFTSNSIDQVITPQDNRDCTKQHFYSNILFHHICEHLVS